VELTGAEYEVLSDGRERCMNCSRTAVKSEAEFAEIYLQVKKNLERFFGARITIPVHVKMVNAKRLHRHIGKTFVPTSGMDSRTIGLAVKKGNDFTLLVENGAPRMSTITTVAHELTHIWQYEKWDKEKLKATYSHVPELELYEGMARWAEIQYAYLINEPATAKRMELVTRATNDEYGRGFLRYVGQYPLSEHTRLTGSTPFDDPMHPLK
jgi:hypothetical protein